MALLLLLLRMCQLCAGDCSDVSYAGPGKGHVCLAVCKRERGTGRGTHTLITGTCMCAAAAAAAAAAANACKGLLMEHTQGPAAGMWCWLGAT
jgi:hypothetical protein